VAQNIETLIVGRFFCGIAGSAFLTVAPATVVDLFAPAHMQAPMMVFTITPFLGPVLGPVIGGFINQFTSWRWTFYILIIWSTTLLVCLIFVPETYHPVLLARKAAALRKETGSSAYRSASEIANAKRSVANTILHSLYRPFQLLLLEPMVLCLSIYSALLLGILYLFFGAFPLVFSTIHGFNLWQTGLSFLGIGVGMLFACLSNPFWRKNYLRLIANWKKNQGSEKGNAMLKPEPEFRLPPAIAGGILVPIGMFVGVVLIIIRDSY
jgi:MFS family permease